MKKRIAWLLTVLLMLGACAPALADTYAGDYVYADTPLDSVSDAGLHNIELAVGALNGLALEPGELFSFNDTVGPRTRAEGYRGALNGRGVMVTGGGVAQVASTVYLAVKDLDCVEIIDKSTYGDRFTDGYVEDTDDAIVTDYNAGTDFSFYYTGDGELRIELSVEDDELCCQVYETLY